MAPVGSRVNLERRLARLEALVTPFRAPSVHDVARAEEIIREGLLRRLEELRLELPAPPPTEDERWASDVLEADRKARGKAPLSSEAAWEAFSRRLALLRRTPGEAP